MSEIDTTSVQGDFVPKIFCVDNDDTIIIRGDIEEKEPIYIKLTDGDIYLLEKVDGAFIYLVNQKGELVMKQMEKK